MKIWISRHVRNATMRITSLRLGPAVWALMTICMALPVVPELMASAVPSGGQQFTYESFLRGSRKGVTAAGFVFEPLSTTNQFVLHRGTVSFVGMIQPPPPQPASTSFFPTQLRVLISHQTETGQIISRSTFDLSVQSDGRILRQEFPFPNDIVVRSKERLVSSLIPLDAALPYCILRLTTALNTQIPVDSAVMNLTSPPFPRPGIIRAAYSVAQPISAQAKGRETFHFTTNLLEGKGFAWRAGAISVSGNFVSISAGSAAIPRKVEMIIRHLSSGGKVVSVDSDVIQVQPSGKILLQKFALSTIAPDKSLEKLEFSFVPVDAAIPAGNLEMKFSFSPQ